eukprot:2732288-Rhodomonas_salina.1
MREGEEGGRRGRSEEGEGEEEGRGGRGGRREGAEEGRPLAALSSSACAPRASVSLLHFNGSSTAFQRLFNGSSTTAPGSRTNA